MDRERKLPEKSHHFIIGPLNLDRQTKRANTAMGMELNLDANTFMALDLLATHEGETLIFEQIYDEVWGISGDKNDPEVDGRLDTDADSRETARETLNALIEQVRVAGEGFMWIDYQSETGYTFQTHWAHNWNTIEKTLSSNTAQATSIGDRESSWRHWRWRALLLAGIGMAVGVFIITLAIPRLLSPVIELHEEVLPLGMPKFQSEIRFPLLDEIRISENKLETPGELQNPECNTCNLVFEIVLKNEGEILYISEPIEPGTEGKNATLTRPLDQGDYEAILQIRAYVMESVDPLESIETEIMIRAIKNES